MIQMSASIRQVGSRHGPNHRLIELRVNEGMAPSDLAYRAGVSAKSIRLAEMGFIPGPRVQFAIASAFGLRPTDIFPLHAQRRASRGR
jgi:DNA-binding XRE family transcriptional regulator